MNKSPVSLPEWKALQNHFEKIKNIHLSDLFKENPTRFSLFSLEFDDFLFDYSKNRINEESISLLLKLAEASQLNIYIEKMFGGDKINTTENRAVLHTALRNFSDSPVLVDKQNVMPMISNSLSKVHKFSEQVRSKEWKGATGESVKDIVHIGIGGSDLGPKLICRSLAHLSDGPNIHFVSNVDGDDIDKTLKKCTPSSTLFIIASKTFTTLETMTNANTAKQWIEASLGKGTIAKHFVALSTNTKKVIEFGIDKEFIFEFWDFVGGRYSVWSSIGLPIACSIGFKKFKEFLSGANEMDRHFKNAPLNKNMPVLLGLIGIFYNNFFNFPTQAILPYSQALEYLPAYLQQLDMESNGKSIQKNDLPVDFETGPIIWGEPGTNGQHAFYQLLHQGTKIVPSDFIGFKHPHHSLIKHHDQLMANFFAQTEALAFGRPLLAQSVKDHTNLDKNEVSSNKHRLFKGNRPTNSILIDRLTPKAMGKLLALYEHKIFTQGIIWNINSFDQWGVELGKDLAKNILLEINSGQVGKHDDSTTHLINHYCNKSNK